MLSTMVYSEYTKKRILYYHQHGYYAPTIRLLLQKNEDLQTSRVGVAKFISKFNATGDVDNETRIGKTNKETERVKEIIETQTREDDKTIAYHLHCLLVAKGFQINKKKQLFVAKSAWNGPSGAAFTVN